MKITVLLCFNSPVVLVKFILHEGYSNSVPIPSIKTGRWSHQKKQLLQNLAYSEEKIYFLIIADFI